MRRIFLALAALTMLVAPAIAQVNVQRVPLAIAWDLDGLGLDVDYNVLATTVADSKDDYVISAGINEVCRINNLTLTDADSSITAGVFTITGTDCWGDALVCTYTADASGSGTKTLVKSSGTANTCAFKTITDVANGVLTGETAVDDKISVGYPAVSGYVYPIYGIRQIDNQGHRFVNPFRAAEGTDDVTVNGTALASYKAADGGAFQNLAIGDLVYLTTGGKTFERRLVAVASDDSATMDVALPSDVAPATTAQVEMQYKKRFLLREDQDAWVPVGGSEGAYIVYDVDANANTGGVISSIEGAIQNSFTSDAFDPIIQVDTDTVATGATGTNTTSIDLRLAPFTHVRAGVQFGTGDDADAANEDINLILMISKRN